MLSGRERCKFLCWQTDEKERFLSLQQSYKPVLQLSHCHHKSYLYTCAWIHPCPGHSHLHVLYGEQTGKEFQKHQICTQSFWRCCLFLLVMLFKDLILSQVSWLSVFGTSYSFLLHNLLATQLCYHWKARLRLLIVQFAILWSHPPAQPSISQLMASLEGLSPPSTLGRPQYRQLAPTAAAAAAGSVTVVVRCHNTCIYWHWHCLS